MDARAFQMFGCRWTTVNSVDSVDSVDSLDSSVQAEQRGAHGEHGEQCTVYLRGVASVKGHKTGARLGSGRAKTSQEIEYISSARVRAVHVKAAVATGGSDN